MDNRLGERVSIHRAIQLISTRPHRASIGRLINLSRSGAFIAGCETQLFSLVQVALDPHLRQKQVEDTIAAYVTRVCDEGVGVEWCEFAPPVVTELLQVAMRTSLDVYLQGRMDTGPREVTSDTAPSLSIAS